MTSKLLRIGDEVRSKQNARPTYKIESISPKVGTARLRCIDKGYEDLTYCARLEILQLIPEEYKRLEELARKLTAFRSAEELLTARGDYRPSIDISESPEHKELADLYDAHQAERKDKRRAFRYGVNIKSIFAYKNTGSIKGSAQRHRIDIDHIKIVRKWYDQNGNPSYGYIMADGTTYLMIDDYSGASKLPITVSIDIVKRRKDLVEG